MKTIITIGRQYGSGGGAVAKKLSEIMEIPCYDRDALVALAENHGIPRETFEKADEQATSSFLFSMALSSYSGSLVHFGVNENSITDRVFNIQSAEIKKIADAGSCIIVGRCADDVLSDHAGLIKVFVRAPLEERIKRIIARMPDLDEQAAKKLINKTDKKRANYYNFYTNRDWGDINNYELCINSAVLGRDKTAEMIFEYIKTRENR